MSPADNFEKIILDAVKPLLKQNGYKKTKGTFTKKVGTQFTGIINFQRSSGCTANYLKFAINLAIHWDDLTVWLERHEEVSSYWKCHWQKRIGDILPDSRDIWWSVENEEEAIEIADYLKTKVIETAVLEVDRHCDEGVLRKKFNAGQLQNLMRGDFREYGAVLQSHGLTWDKTLD